MARFTISCIRHSDGTFILVQEGDAVNSVATTTVNSDVATLVADGATPTQAHVNTLNTDWTALKAGTGAIPSQTDLVVSFDGTKWTRSNLKLAFLQLGQSLDSGIGGLGA